MATRRALSTLRSGAVVGQPGYIFNPRVGNTSGISAGCGHWCGWNVQQGLIYDGICIDAGAAPGAIDQITGALYYLTPYQADHKNVVLDGRIVRAGVIATELVAGDRCATWGEYEGTRTLYGWCEELGVARLSPLAASEYLFVGIPVRTPDGLWLVTQTHAGLIVYPWGGSSGYVLEGDFYYHHAMFLNGAIAIVATNAMGGLVRVDQSLGGAAARPDAVSTLDGRTGCRSRDRQTVLARVVRIHGSAVVHSAVELQFVDQARRPDQGRGRRAIRLLGAGRIGRGNRSAGDGLDLAVCRVLGCQNLAALAGAAAGRLAGAAMVLPERRNSGTLRTEHGGRPRDGAGAVCAGVRGLPVLRHQRRADVEPGRPGAGLCAAGARLSTGHDVTDLHRSRSERSGDRRRRPRAAPGLSALLAAAARRHHRHAGGTDPARTDRT